MAVDLPPPLVPQPASVEFIEARSTDAPQSLSFETYRIQLIGNRALSQAELERIVTRADTLSDVVRGLGQTYYLDGYPATQLIYALSGSDLYVLVLPGRVTAISGPDSLLPYFEPARQQPQLTAASLEPGRVLAGVHSDRMGLKVSSTLVPELEPGRYRLALQAESARTHPLALRFEIGNPGNRFSGRHFAEGEVAWSGGGSELKALWRERIAGARGSAYHDRAVLGSQVTPWGLFGLDVRDVEYVQTSAGQRFDGAVDHWGFSWSAVPYADFSRRWLVSLRADHIDDEIRDSANGARLLKQRYDSLEVGFTRSEVWNAGWGGVELQLGLAARGGVGNSNRVMPRDSEVSLDYQLLRPSLRVRLDPAGDSRWRLGFDASAHLSDDVLPQQQQLVLGGSDNLAAWLPGVALGDRGGYLRMQAESRYGSDRLRLSPRVFVEFGNARLEQAQPGQPSGTQTLADIGVEVLLQADRWLETALIAALPLHEDGSADAGLARADFYYRVSIRF